MLCVRQTDVCLKVRIRAQQLIIPGLRLSKAGLNTGQAEQLFILRSIPRLIAGAGSL